MARNIKAVVLGALFVACSVFQVARAETERFSLGQWGQFEIDLPDDWSAVVSGPNSRSGVAIRIVPNSDVPLVLLVTPIPVPDADTDIGNAVAESAERARAQLGEVAEEDELVIQRLSGRGCEGLYVSATDRTVTEPSMDDFKYGTQGAAKVGRLLMTFTVLTNDKTAPERAVALEIVKSARHIPPTSP
jgi:hypothetical protein